MTGWHLAVFFQTLFLDVDDDSDWRWAMVGDVTACSHLPRIRTCSKTNDIEIFPLRAKTLRFSVNQILTTFFQITVPSILIACGSIQIVVCAAMGYKMSCYMGRRGQNNFDVENSTTKLEPAGVSRIPPTY